ncbi:sensor histidine kinase [Streptomyces sp. NPDC014646]|uniref:sensor histidine kinase n=1 Tax=Streptomyces sp. NPDC014646 TaxID=3364877 RepID=UPI0036FA4556
MTETKTRSPEFRLAARALGGLRQDLFKDAFAYRPLERMRTDGPLTGRLPGRMRARAAWTPHALVGVAAFFVAVMGLASGDSSGLRFMVGGVATVLLPVATVLMTLVRPVGAFWASLAIAPFAAIFGSDGWPWTPSMFLSQLVVLVVVAARTRPRTAAWMWGITGLYGALLEGLGGRYSGGTNGPLAFASALALLLVAVVQIRRDAEREVTVQRTVTAVERDRRTLLEERTTIARELHDVVAHHMSVVAIQAEAAPYRVENPPPELEQAFATIRENAVSALTELRRVLGVVRADDQQVPDAPQPTLAQLDGLLANVREAGLETEKTVTGAIRELPQGVELSAYRIIQEALSNTLRHAPGATAKVEIGYVLGGLGLRVVNGPPTAPVKPSPGAGHGITGMRERVTMLNGTMTAGASEEGGYEIAAFIPVALDFEASTARDMNETTLVMPATQGTAGTAATGATEAPLVTEATLVTRAKRTTEGNEVDLVKAVSTVDTAYLDEQDEQGKQGEPAGRTGRVGQA